MISKSVNVVSEVFALKQTYLFSDFSLNKISLYYIHLVFIFKIDKVTAQNNYKKGIN